MDWLSGERRGLRWGYSLTRVHGCKLDFESHFHFNDAVSAADQVASLTGVVPADAGRGGAIAFTTTQWSVVLTAQGQSPAADEALEKLCRLYWWPLYGFVRRQGHAPEEAQDLTQGFFAMLLGRRDLDAVRREKGRLRSYLLASLKNFLAKAHRREMAVKRGEGRPLVALEELLARERADLEPADTLSADRIYERRWALTLLDQVFARELRMTENAVTQAFHRLRQRYRQLVREEIAHTVAVPGDVDDELRHFIAV